MAFKVGLLFFAILHMMSIEKCLGQFGGFGGGFGGGSSAGFSSQTTNFNAQQSGGFNSGFGGFGGGFGAGGGSSASFSQNSVNGGFSNNFGGIRGGIFRETDEPHLNHHLEHELDAPHDHIQSQEHHHHATARYASPYDLPVYEAPYHPIVRHEQPQPQQQSYGSPAPQVQCGSNLLAGCSPTVREVPCSANY